jgi:hypothetical protein
MLWEQGVAGSDPAVPTTDQEPWSAGGAGSPQFRDGWNQRCRPLTWTKDADQILTGLKRQDTSTKRSRKADWRR